MSQAHAAPASPAKAQGSRSRPARGTAALLGLLVGLAAASAFLPTLGNGFVKWDDYENIVRNFHFRGLGLPQIRWAWTTYLLGVYQPLAWMFLEAQYAAWGLAPWGYHLVSLLVHAINVVVLMFLSVAVLDRCTGGAGPPARSGARFVGAALAASLFGVHPLRTEVVAWTSCQPYLPCALFAMLTVLAYLRACPPGRPTRVGWLAAALVLLTAALLFKAVAVTVPAILLILNVYPLRRLGGGPGTWLGPAARRTWLELLPFALVGLLFALISVDAKAAVRSLSPVEPDAFSSRLAQACYGVWFYLVKTVVPLGLTAYYPRPERMDPLRMPYVACVGATLAATAAAVLLRRRWPGLAAAWLVYLATLAPNLGLVRIGQQIAADRYCYVPMLGLTVALAFLLERAVGAAQRRGLLIPVGAVAAVVLLGLTTASWAQCLSWRDTATLWTRAVARSASGDALARINLGDALEEQGRLDEAARCYEEASRLDPRLASAPTNLGGILARKGDYRGAMACYERALRIDPDHAATHNNMGLAYTHLGDEARALAHFERAVRLEPNFAEALVNLAQMRAGRGQLDQAIADYRRALRLNPDSLRAQRGLEEALRSRARPLFRP